MKPMSITYARKRIAQLEQELAECKAELNTQKRKASAYWRWLKTIKERNQVLRKAIQYASEV